MADDDQLMLPKDTFEQGLANSVNGNDARPALPTE
jgi:hypothetical protein